MNELVYLLLGSNLGDREATIRNALQLLETEGFGIEKFSGIYETEPWGLKDQPLFLNMVVGGKWKLEPEELLILCQEIEIKSGRVRSVKWGERILDIDILYFGSEMISTDNLTVPHPGIPVRKFTLQPLSEIAGKMKHPVLKKTTEELLKECDDDIGVRYLKEY